MIFDTGYRIKCNQDCSLKVLDNKFSKLKIQKKFKN